MFSDVYYCALMCVTAATTVLRAFAADGAATSARIMNFGITGALYRVQVIITAFTKALRLAAIIMATTSVYHTDISPFLELDNSLGVVIIVDCAIYVAFTNKKSR